MWGIFLGFFLQWLVSLTKRVRYTEGNEDATESVSCEISVSKELLNKQSGFPPPPVYSLKRICAHCEFKIQKLKSGKLGMRLN